MTTFVLNMNLQQDEDRRDSNKEKLHMAKGLEEDTLETGGVHEQASNFPLQLW